jgi:hypothetical protein
VRALITVDTRQQTQYGVLRTYILLGYSQDTAGAAGAETTSPAVYMTRGFIQVAGFTLGKATSFFDIYPNASFGYNVGTMYVPDTGDAGKILATYTAQFGNGLSASIGIEQARDASVVNTSFATTSAGIVGGAVGIVTARPYVLGAPPVDNSLGGIAAGVNGWADIVGNLRMDQAWGSLLAAFALHNASGGYYGVTTFTTANGHPSDKWGWAATVGAIFNLPMIAPGDRFSFQFVYSEGAIKYAAVTPGGASMLHYGGGTAGFGFFEDGVFSTGSGVQLTTAWSIGAGFEHLWTPALRTSIYGSYIDVSHNAAARGMICASGGVWVNSATCNPDWTGWVLGSRTQWEPVRGWIMGVDVLYSSLKTANPGSATITVASGAQPAGALVGNQSAWVLTFRTQRDYHP